MVTYTVIPRLDGGYDVQTVWPNGTRQTIVGFTTKAAADDWIARKKRLTSGDDQAPSGGFRMSWNF
jgi:hypothetical protein